MTKLNANGNGIDGQDVMKGFRVKVEMDLGVSALLRSIADVVEFLGINPFQSLRS
jgi:hypothetical protein